MPITDNLAIEASSQDHPAKLLTSTSHHFHHIKKHNSVAREGTNKKMDENVKPSFHGSLSRFAYVGPRVPSAPTPTSFESSLSSHGRPSRSHSDPDTARAQPRNGIAFSNVLDSDDAGDVRADITPSSTLASKREAGERTEKL